MSATMPEKPVLSVSPVDAEHDSGVPEPFEEARRDAIAFIKRETMSSGSDFLDKMPPMRREIFINAAMGILSTGNAKEIAASRAVLRHSPYEKKLEYFGELSVFDDATQRRAAAYRAEKIKDKVNPLAKHWPEALEMAKAVAKETLLVHPIVIPALVALGLPLMGLEVAAQTVLAVEAINVAMEVIDRRMYPTAALRFQRQTDLDKVPVLSTVEKDWSAEKAREKALEEAPESGRSAAEREAMKAQGLFQNPEHSLSERREMALKSRDLVVRVLHATRPSVRLSLHDVSERDLMEFCDNALREFAVHTPPIDVMHPLHGDNRADAHKITDRLAANLGFTPSWTQKGLAGALAGSELLRERTHESVVHLLSGVPALSRLAKRWETELPSDVPAAAKPQNTKSPH